MFMVRYLLFSSPPLPLPISPLPTRIIFIDDRLQNCFSVYESLSSLSLFDKFYNLPYNDKKRQHNHLPSALELYTCHYQPAVLCHNIPTSTQTGSVQAALSQQHNPNDSPDFELIETQIHHFLTHGEILRDPDGHAMIKKIRAEQREKLINSQQIQTKEKEGGEKSTKQEKEKEKDNDVHMMDSS
jgi:hypothetical protein